MQPHRWQPTRLPHPWDSPGKKNGVVCHFLLQCMKVKSESEVAQSCLILSDPMDYSLPGSSHGIFQAKKTGVGCHFLLQCMKVESESEVAQSCLILSDPMDCSLPSSSIHGIFQARVLEWVAIAFKWQGKILIFSIIITPLPAKKSVLVMLQNKNKRFSTGG